MRLHWIAWVVLGLIVLAALALIFRREKVKNFLKVVLTPLNTKIQNNEFGANALNALSLTSVGVILALYSDLIGEQSRNALDILTGMKNEDDYEASWGTIIFWVGQLLSAAYLVILIYNHGKIDKQKITKNEDFLTEINTDLRAAIHYAPNPRVFQISLKLYFETLSDLISLDSKPIETFKNDYEKIFKLILDKLCLLTNTFNNKIQASYCANIMPYIHSFDELPIEEMAGKGDIFLYEEKDLKKYFVRGILQGRKELKFYRDRVPNDERVINLPILFTLEGEGIYIPGAGEAVRKYENVVGSTDMNKHKYYDDLPKDIRDRFKNYFDQDGKEMRSIVSFIIPNPDFAMDRGRPELISDKDRPRILGVLNIDCNEEEILGSYEKYYETYFVLIWPFIVKLAPYLQSYLNYEKTNKA